VRKEVVSTPTNHTELKNLAILNHLQHPNIAKLLACYSYQYKINLIFPLAEQGTLRDLLNADRGYITDELKDFTVDYKVLRALAGLSSALDSVHNYVNHKIDLRLSGLHHDLNPKNVLISRSTFLLGDFGLSRFKDVLEPSRTLWRDTLGYYAAPECLELDTMKKPLIGRKSEIWAFGCMLADIAIWMLFGPAGILEFTSTRKFSAGAGVTLAVFHHGIGAKNPVVEEWTRKLHNQAPHSWQPLIALIERMLSIDEACRPNSTQVTVQLQMITIATILEDINRTFTTSISEDASLDARIEHWRLQAWADTMNVHQPEAWNSQALDRVRRDQAFEHSIRHLCNILDVLGQIQHVDKRFRMIAHTIDQLANTLDTPQRTQMNMKFRDLVLNDSNVATLDAFQQLEVKDGLERDLRLQITLKFMSQKVATHANFGEESQKLDVGSIVNRDDQHAESTSGDRDLEGNPEDKNHFTTAEFRMHGTVTKILIEWRSYVQSPADEEIHKELFTRVNSVAYIMGFDKPSHLRLLNCRGYFHEESKTAFGMVYDFPEPTATAQNWEVVNLLKIFSQTTKKETQPPLNHRFKLAILLARAIFEFHKVGWVHKNIASSNVVFFSESATPHGQRVAEPYLTGFHHCRPDEPEGFSEGIPKNIDEDYQHPEYLRNRSGYVSEYDYYSLGLVLLEIGYWRPLSLLKVNKYSGDERCEKILEQTAPLLVQYMGIEYAEAVRACLDGSVARDSFDTKVLGRLTGVTLSEFSSWHTL
jgi:serine/threonine protein kinase